MKKIFNCPHCGTRVMMENPELDSIFMARRICEKCNGEILIVNDVPMKHEDYKESA